MYTILQGYVELNWPVLVPELSIVQCAITGRRKRFYNVDSDFANAFDGGSPTGNNNRIDLEYDDIDILDGALSVDVELELCQDYDRQSDSLEFTYCITQTVTFKNP